jgi:hypothetical protein
MNNKWRKMKFKQKTASGRKYLFRFERDGIPGRFLFWHRYPIRIKVMGRPPCPYPAANAHLLPGAYICIAAGLEIHRVEQAKAIAVHWMRGFEVYRKSGVFPNGKASVQVD